MISSEKSDKNNYVEKPNFKMMCSISDAEEPLISLPPSQLRERQERQEKNDEDGLLQADVLDSVQDDTIATWFHFTKADIE
jgi:hypothetical protein